MNLTTQVMFNFQERTLPEIVVLAASSRWEVVRVTKTAASLFRRIIAVPAAIYLSRNEPGLAVDLHSSTLLLLVQRRGFCRN
ncbi:hypothetical protein BYT27DRAFT_7270619 [Phlegmacium glaucopus]|nr:hypothetical protein BYT27DRAFT_7270619 [Phlegmacium glaucopus]